MYLPRSIVKRNECTKKWWSFITIKYDPLHLRDWKLVKQIRPLFTCTLSQSSSAAPFLHIKIMNIYYNRSTIYLLNYKVIPINQLIQHYKSQHQFKLLHVQIDEREREQYLRNSRDNHQSWTPRGSSCNLQWLHLIISCFHLTCNKHKCTRWTIEVALEHI